MPGRVLVRGRVPAAGPGVHGVGQVVLHAVLSLGGGVASVRVAGFIILDGIRMLCEKMYTLILHFNFYTNIILVFKYIKGIILFGLEWRNSGKK